MAERESVTIGILALQGAFREHEQVLKRLRVRTRQVRKPEEMLGVNGLIIPGGESTSIGKLMVDYDLIEPVRRYVEDGGAVFGTCAGLILMAGKIEGGSRQPRLGFMNTIVERNAFGRQVDSFEEDINIPVLGNRPFRAVFIRAPYIARVGPEVEVLALLGERIVCARQGRLLAAAFHPELTNDTRLHKFFLSIAAGGKYC